MPKPSVGVVGTDMEWGPMGELMTEKGGPMPLTGELSVLMGEGSCPGEPSEAPRPGPRDGCSEGAAMELRPVGEPRDEELTWVEKSAREGTEGGQGPPRTARYPWSAEAPEAVEWGAPAPGKAAGAPILVAHGREVTKTHVGPGQGARSSPPRHQAYQAQADAERAG